jgi:predicted membrane protein
MQNKTTLFLGTGLILIGILAVIKVLTGFDFWVFLFPILIILFGVFLIMRPNMTGNNAEFIFRFLGEFEETGNWPVRNQEIWVLVGDVELDFRTAEIPTGVTEISIYGFVQDIRIREPQGVGVIVESNAFVMDRKIHGNKQDHIFSSTAYKNENYTASDRKIHIKTWGFVGEIKLD